MSMHALSCLFVTPGAAAHQAPLSMEFPRQEYWSGLLFSPPEHLPNPEIEHMFSVSPALAGGIFTTEPPGKPSADAQYILKWRCLGAQMA